MIVARRASGREYLALVTQLLQRARLADAEAGLWEAADLQWWWRLPRSSDVLEQLFWVDGDGPVAAVVLTDWGRWWGCDPLVVPGASTRLLAELWGSALEAIDALGLEAVDVLVRDDDAEQRALLDELGFVAVADDAGGTTWMDAADRPPVSALPDGFALVDRERATGPHPMRGRNGEQVEARLRECSLYDPSLDLEVVFEDGDTAGYALFWFDPSRTSGSSSRCASRTRTSGAASPAPCSPRASSGWRGEGRAA